MSNQPNIENPDCAGEAAAYVLGALAPAEAQAFEAHLAECAICHDEVDSLEGVVRALPMAAPQYLTPRRLRRRVMGSIRKETSRARPRSRTLLHTRRLRPRLALAAVAAVAAAATIAAVSVTTSSQISRVIQASVAGPGSAELVLNDGRADLIARRLSPPPPGQIYEVWLKAPHKHPTPAGVLFRPTSNTTTDVALTQSLHGISQVMVTQEPQNGTLVPTHAPVIVARLT